MSSNQVELTDRSAGGGGRRPEREQQQKRIRSGRKLSTGAGWDAMATAAARAQSQPPLACASLCMSAKYRHIKFILFHTQAHHETFS